MKANMRQNIIPNPKQTKKHHLSIQDNGEMETDESSQEEGNDMTLEMNDLTLEGVHFNKEKVLLAIAYHISPEKVAPRFGPRIEEYKNKFERSDNNCVMLGILAGQESIFPKNKINCIVLRYQMTSGHAECFLICIVSVAIQPNFIGGFTTVISTSIGCLK